MNEKEIILKLLNITYRHIDKIHLHMLLNIKDYTQNYEDYPDNSVSTEFLSLQELEELLNSVQKFGIYTTVYYDVCDFIKKTIETSFTEYDILYDTTQKGIGNGKDALIPAWCDIVKLKHTGSNAVFNVFTNDKYCWNKFLLAHGFPTPKSWKYSNLSHDFISGTPPNNMKLICKPIYECASIGIDKLSIANMSPEYMTILEKKANLYSQPLIVQEFIAGYEVEVPVMSTSYGNLILPPVGISINQEKNLQSNFLGFDTVYDDKYGFFNFSSFEPEIANQIKNIIDKLLLLIDFNGYARIDFRVDMISKQAYITDINAYPHIVNHSSFAESFRILGLNQEFILPALVGNAL